VNKISDEESSANKHNV